MLYGYIRGSEELREGGMGCCDLPLVVNGVELLYSICPKGVTRKAYLAKCRGFLKPTSGN